MYKLRTIDIWDTLIRRTCHPEAVKLATALHVFLRFHDRLNQCDIDHWRLLEERVAVERLLAEQAEASGHDGEYELTAVIQRWLGAVLDPGDPSETAMIAKDIAERELAFEIAHTFLDDGIADFVAAFPAQRTLYLSDFYMTCDMLGRLLRHHEIDRLVPSGIVSCEAMLNKRSGRLFAHVQRLHGITPAEHVHIGDNPYSDFETPRRQGIRAVAYQPDVAHAARTERERLFASREGLFNHIGGQVDNALRALPSDASESATMFRIGCQVAPLFIGFALFVAERAIIDKVDRLFFLTREGEFFIRLYDTLFPDRRLAGLPLPPAAVLPASRHATFAASLDAISVAELSRIWRLNWHQKLSTLFGILGLDPGSFASRLARLGLSPDEMIIRPQDDPRIAALLRDTSFIEAATASVMARKATLTAYLHQQGIRSGDKIGLVDIGWRGSIQDNIAYLIPECKTVGYYLALRAFINSQPSNVVKHAFGPDERTEDVASFFESFEPLELLCNSPLGSVSGYRETEDGIIVPIREVNDTENIPINRFTRHFQDGVNFAAKTYRPLLMDHSVTSGEMRAMALHVWQRLASRPPEELLKAYYAAPQHDAFGFGGFFDRGQPPSLATLLRAPFHRTSRHTTIQYIRRTQWVPAISELNIGPFHRLTLTSMFWLAHRYKRLVVLRRSRRRGRCPRI